MLHNFPDAYPEELFYSMCARYAEIMLFLSDEKVGRYLFNRRNPRPIIDFPSDLNAFVSNLAPNHIVEVNTIIDEHSLLPYYTPFLHPDRVQTARKAMVDGFEHGLHTIAGNANSQSNNIETLYYCAECACENREEYGKAYWHRVHQLPDVHICPTHNVWLTQYDAYNPHTRIYVSAERVIPTNATAEPVDLSNEENKLLLYIAEQSLWLLQNPHISTTPEFLRQQYAVAFHNIGLASYKGSIASSKVLKAFREKYPETLLDTLECSLKQSVNKNWLTGRLLRDDRHSYPTIRHLIALHFLNIPIQEFVDCQLQRQPFGDGKFPCLNLICNHYREFVISDIRITEDVYGDPQGYFQCPKCGFEYMRHGPDFEAYKWEKAMKVITFGHVWKRHLKQYIEADISINEIAKMLRAGKNTIKKQIDKLGLPMPKSSKAKRIKHNPYKTEVDPEKLAEMKQQWLDKQAKNPQFSFVELRQACEHEYYYISTWDERWLDENSPERRRRGSEAEIGCRVRRRNSRNSRNNTITYATCACNDIKHCSTNEAT